MNKIGSFGIPFTIEPFLGSALGIIITFILKVQEIGNLCKGACVSAIGLEFTGFS